MTLNSLFAQYLEWKRIGGASEHTLRAYSRNLAKLLAALGEDAEHETLNAFSLQNFVGYLRLAGLSDNSIAQALAAAKSFVTWACNEGVYPDNFAQAVRGPRRPPRVPKVPSIDEMQQVLECGLPSSWPERDRLVLELLYGCGLRNSELVGLNLGDRLKQDEWLVRGKGKKERKVPMSEPARNALTNYLPTRKRILTFHQKDATALILNLRGDRITTRSVGRLVKQIALAKGLSRTTHPHLLRHACAGHMLERGAHLSDVKTLLGHARLATTLVYSGGTNWKRMRESYDRTFNR
jgi:integrase/recombinase XerC